MPMIKTASASAYPIDHKGTRRDLAIGFIFSLCFFVGACWLSEAFKGGPPKPKPKDDTPRIQMVMPKVEPDEEPVETDQAQQAPAEIAPPMQTDVPQLVTDTSFVQKLEPPPPEGMAVDKAALTVSANLGFGKGQQIFDLSMLDQPPIPTYQAQPNYPYDMKKAGITGTVTVAFVLEADGHVSGAYAESATQHEFEANAIQAVMKWRFRPGRRGGKAVRVHMSVPIKFILEDQ
jgi:periplasmic protein TonB